MTLKSINISYGHSKCPIFRTKIGSRSFPFKEKAGCHSPKINYIQKHELITTHTCFHVYRQQRHRHLCKHNRTNTRPSQSPRSQLNNRINRTITTITITTITITTIVVVVEAADADVVSTKEEAVDVEIITITITTTTTRIHGNNVK